MFIVSLTYTRDISEIEKYLPAHLDYLERYYAAGKFIASGRKNPRTGGVILVLAQNRDELDSIIAEDPFKINDLANFEVTEFIPNKTAEQFAFLRERTS